MNRLKALPVAMMLALTAVALPAAQPAVAAETAAVSESDLREHFPQPYIVKEGDTLWDIANHFFKDPWRWLKIWERNLYITNPDLIYPGNEIWFDPNHAGGLTTVRPQPAVLSGPVERLEAAGDSSVLLGALARQDFINPDEIDGVGHVLAGQDERINFGVHDGIYLTLQVSAKAGDEFDIFRSGEVMTDPATGEPAGVLIEHLGRIRVDSYEDGVYRGTVLQAFEEISRGDRVRPAHDVDTKIVPEPAAATLSGHIMYIRNNDSEAGQNQVCGITLGNTDGLKAGMEMTIYRAGRVVVDKVTGEEVRLPKERIGSMLVLVPQDHASLAMITNSTAAVNVGDMVAGSGR